MASAQFVDGSASAWMPTASPLDRLEALVDEIVETIETVDDSLEFDADA